MKKTIFTLITTALIFTGCAKEKAEPADIIVEYADITELNVLDYGHNDTLYIYARKSWDDGQKTQVRCINDNALINDYNKKYSEKLQPLPQDCYKLITDIKEVGGEKLYAIFEIEINQNAFKLTQDGKQYAIGFKMLENGKPLKAGSGAFVAKVNLRTPTLKFEEPLLITHLIKADAKTTTIKLPIITTFINKDWMTFDLDTTATGAKIEAYNAANGTHYANAIAQPSKIIWIKDSLVLNRGENRKDLEIHMDYLDHITPEGAMLPVSLSNIKAFNLPGHTFKPDAKGNTVYVVIRREKKQ